MNALRTAVTVAAAVAAAGAATAALPAGPAPAVAPVETTRVAAAKAFDAPEVHDRAAPVRVAARPRHDHASHAHAAPVAIPVAVAAKAASAPAPARPEPARRVAWDGRAFATPEAAMRFLVAAYNAHDDAAIKHVTTPDARANLLPMRDIAPALRVKSCAKVEDGAYECAFTHSTPKSTAQTGYATFRVAPATKPGWYMTVLVDCGD